MRAVEASLRRLGTDHIDLYQVHRPEEETEIEETLSALTDLQRAGTIRAFGSSTFHGWQIVEAQWAAERRGLERFRTEQPPYSILARHAELDVLPVAAAHRMGVLVWAPLGRGWLTGRYRRGGFDRSPDSRATRSAARGGPVAAQFDEGRARSKQARHRRATRADRRAGRDPMAHMAVAFTLAHPAVTSAIVGPRTPDQLENLLAGQDLRLDATTLDAIDAVVPPGSTVDQGDRGFSPWWLEPSRRRRSTA